jgi:hypothetical protein
MVQPGSRRRRGRAYRTGGVLRGVRASLLSPEFHKPLKVDPRGRYSNSWQSLVAQLHGLIGHVGLDT